VTEAQFAALLAHLEGLRQQLSAFQATVEFELHAARRKAAQITLGLSP
jgi:hypothetical protein